MKRASSQTLPPGLYIVPTPIGNLGDITLRALETLKSADLIACEDTRVTAKLLNHYAIKKPLLSYNDHNGEERRPEILSKLAEGNVVVLVSDAGTPLVSDPGYKLAREALEQGIYVTALPGASSILPALCLSGLPTDAFFFAGFLPAKQEACRKYVASLAAIPSTLVFFESARRLSETIALLLEGLGDRPAAVVREISKLYEESRRGPLSELQTHYEVNGAPKGEVVIVVGAPQAHAVDIDIDAALKELLKEFSVKDASSMLAKETGLPRREIYERAVKMDRHADQN